MLGEGWSAALQRLADAAGAGGASLVRIQGSRSVAQISSDGWAENEAERAAGRAPPIPMQFYPSHAFEDGFVVDHDVWTDDEMRRDPYYQEFLRPRGVFFHAKVRLYYDPDERLSLTLKRRIRLGPYEPADIARLDAIVPELRAVFRMARCVLDAEASGLVRALRHRGDPVFELGTSGRVLRVHGDDAERSGLLVRNRRLVAADRLAQPQLARAIAAALQPPQRGSLAVITDERGERRFLRIMPVTGGARDVFIATAAIAVLIQPTQPAPDGLPPDGIRGAFGLTVREAQIARLLADGLSLTEIAGRLLMRIGTARNHLKSIFEKSGATRQGELIALLCKLLP
jgi:DNA-binding CsgD family transcriptional regulator